MRILVVNDDGVKSPHLETIVKVASRYGFVYVAAPIEHQSATSHAITISNRIEVDENVFIPNSEKTIAVGGFPADCVRLGVALFEHNFDLVISGLNEGLNISTDVLYSGTVAAAREANILGLPALAISTDRGYNPNIENHVAMVLDEVIGNKLYEKYKLLNANIPRVEQIKGIKYTHQGMRLYHAEFTKIPDSNDYKITYSLMIYDEGPDADSTKLDEDYIVITPLSIDQTNYKELKSLKK